MKLYTLDNQFIKKTNSLPFNSFTGIIEYESGLKEWRKNGSFHRFDGPALEYTNGTKRWHIDGNNCTEEQHTLLVDIMKLKGLSS